MNKKIHSLLMGLGGCAVALSLTLTGCDSSNPVGGSSGDSNDLPSQATVDDATAYARFDPADGIIPFPNNLLFSGTTDGTLNIPVANPTDYSDPKVAMNTLYGFSTVAPITAQMSVALDPASVVAGQTVRLFQVQTGQGGVVTAVDAELIPGQDYVASVSPLDAKTLAITPLRPLAGATSYLVTLNSGLKTLGGSPFHAEIYYALLKGTAPLVDATGTSQFTALTDTQAQQMEPLRQLVGLQESAVAAYTITNDAAQTIADQSRDGVILSWSFTTQPIGAMLDKVATNVTPQTISVQSTGNPTPGGFATIEVGTMAVPYYLGVPSASDPTAPLTTSWQDADHNGLPDGTQTETIPVLLTIPKTGSAPFPVVIFQHGITQDRTNLLGIADALASVGYAGIAIDLPLHGITNPSNPFYMATYERTFGLDLVDANGQPGPDGQIDPSGTHFINLANLLVTRDNMRQAVSDLLTLHASLGSIPDLDTSRVYFVGHSLGAIVGTDFLAVDGNVGAAVLGMPGGGIPKLLDGSPSFGPVIAAGLAAKGVVKGSVDYESFMMAAQTVLDSADPLNYAAAAAQKHPVLLFEVAGGNSSLPDQVVPNNVMAAAPDGTIPSPTAGTDPLARTMGLTIYSQSQGGTAPLEAWVRFNAGNHSSLLSPNDALGIPDPLSAEVFKEMQTEAAGFLATGGTQLPITDTAVIQLAQ